MGSEGRVELSGSTTTVTTQKANNTKARSRSRFATATYQIGQTAGSHGGTDPRICRDFLYLVPDGKPPVAAPEAGRMAVAVGCAATHSIRNGNVAIDISPCP